MNPPILPVDGLALEAGEQYVISKRDYFIKALNAGAYKHKEWVIRCFAEVQSQPEHSAHYPYQLFRTAEGGYFYIDTEHDSSNSRRVYLEGTFMHGAPFKLLEQITVGHDEVPNIHQNTVTFYGNLLVNYVCLIYAFGDKVTFVAGPMTVAKMEGMIEPRLADTPAAGKERDPAKLYIDEFKRFNDGVRHLEGFTQLCVPSATPKTMTVSDEVIKRRNELFKEYEGQLEDPIIQAHIDKELTQMERDWMKGDPGERFYIKGKSYDVVRKKLFLYQGQESGFGKVGKTITRSLDEGWDVRNLPDMANALRNGSYSRGALTALGGVDAKNNYRMFQNTVVSEPDCGSKLGLRLTLDKDSAKHFIASYVIEADGHLTELTAANLAEYTDKPITLRSVAYCKTENQNVCAICVGSRIAQTPNAISTYASDIGSKFLSAFLAAMHGKAVKSNKVNYLSMLN
jgi:hypothetical protein